MAHDNVSFDPNKEYYKFGGGIKTLSIVLIALGIIGAIWAFFADGGLNHHSRFWSNLLLNTYYFNGIAIAAVFFLAAHTIGYGSWIMILKRVMESFGNFVYVSGFFFLLIVLGLWFDWHTLYDHWVNAPASDTIVGDKVGFLNKPMYTFLTAVFVLLWILAIRWLRKHSSEGDHYTDEIAYNQKAKYLSAFFIVIFGVSTSIFSWIAVMSLDPHWYSTLFGWYNFASYMCGSLSMMILIVSYLKYKGLLVSVNDSHLHNLAIFLFGFSIFWTYLWFSQFMLIWYGNIPEDTMYFYKRFKVPLFKFLFLFTFVVNFVFPLLLLMTRKAKRNYWITGAAAIVLIFGHYLDFYSMVMFEPNGPSHHVDDSEEAGHHSYIKNENTLLLAEHHDEKVETDVPVEEAHTTATSHNETEHHAETPAAHAEGHTADTHHGDGHEVEHHASLGLIELMMFFGFMGLFIFVVLTTLSKERLVPMKTPFLDESIRYHF